MVVGDVDDPEVPQEDAVADAAEEARDRIVEQVHHRSTSEPTRGPVGRREHRRRHEQECRARIEQLRLECVFPSRGDVDLRSHHEQDRGTEPGQERVFPEPPAGTPQRGARLRLRGHDGHQHAHAERHREVREPLLIDGVPAGRSGPHEPDEHQRAEPRVLGLAAEAPGERAHRQRIERQREIEAHLYREAPRLRQPAKRIGHGRVHLRERELLDHRLEPGRGIQRGVVNGDEEDQRHPVRRIDAQHAIAEVLADHRRRLAVEMRVGPPAIEQEARQREEHPHAEAQLREQRMLLVRREVVEVDVVHHDRQRGDGAQTIESDEPAARVHNRSVAVGTRMLSGDGARPGGVDSFGQRVARWSFGAGRRRHDTNV